MDCIGVTNEIHLHTKLYPRCFSQYYDRKYHPSKCHSNIYIWFNEKVLVITYKEKLDRNNYDI